MEKIIVVGGNSMADLRNGIDAALAAMEKGGMMYCVGASSTADLRAAKVALDAMGVGGITNPNYIAPKGCGCPCSCSCDCGCNCEDTDLYDVYDDGYADDMADAEDECEPDPSKSAEDELTDKAKAYLEMLCGMFGVDPSKYGM